MKKRLWHRCFPANFAKYLITPFFIEHLSSCFCFLLRYFGKPKVFLCFQGLQKWNIGLKWVNIFISNINEDILGNRRTSKCDSCSKSDKSSTVTKLKRIRHNNTNKDAVKMSSSYKIYKFVYIMLVICCSLESNKVLQFHMNHFSHFEKRVSIFPATPLNESFTLKIRN